VAALRPLTRRGARALWASVEDTCSGILLWIGEAIGEVRPARGWADVLLGVEPPLAGRAVFLELEHAGGITTIRGRNGCCLAYRLDGGRGATCLTCPRTPWTSGGVGWSAPSEMRSFEYIE